MTEEQNFIRLDWMVSGKRIQERLPVPAEPTRPRRMLPLFRALGERVVEAAVERAVSQGKSISCKAGCGACCRQLVPITPTEAHHIAELLEDLPAAERDRARARFGAAREAFEGAGLLARLSAPETVTAADMEALALDYFRLGVACPFLEEESCSIHPERPIACREYLVSSPAENCSAPTPASIDRVTIACAVSNALGRLDGPPHWVPLALAPAWSEAHPDHGPELPAPEIFGRFIAELEKDDPGKSKARQKADRKRKRRR